MASAALRLFRWQARSGLQSELGAAATSAVLDLAEKNYVPPPLAQTSAGRFNLQMAAYLEEPLRAHPKPGEALFLVDDCRAQPLCELDTATHVLSLELGHDALEL